MSSENNRTSAGVGGTIRLGELMLFIEPLPFRQEVALLDDLRKLAKEAKGDFLLAVEPMLDRLAKLKTPEAANRAAVILETVARMEARQELPGDDAAEQARKSPKGVALELWYRSRRLHPTVQIRDLEAVIVGAEIAADTHFQIRDALGAKDDTKS